MRYYYKMLSQYLEKYIDHVHSLNGVPVKVIDTLKEEILKNFKDMMKLKDRGINLFFTDIDKIKEIMLNKLLVTRN